MSTFSRPEVIDRARGTGPRPWQGRYRRIIVLVWIAVVAAAAPFAARESEHLTGGGFTAPGSASATVTSAVQQDYPGISEAPLGIVLRPAATAGPASLPAAVATVQRTLHRDPQVSLTHSAALTARGQARRSPRTTLVLPLASRLNDQQAIDVAKTLRQQFGVSGTQAGSLAGGQVSVGVVGQGAMWAAMQDLSAKAATQSEAKGFPIIAIVLFLVFGCLAATLLPLVLGAGAVICTGAILFGLSLWAEISLFATDVTSMIGIGVAVDYSLFVLVRYREAIAGGADHQGAIGVAMRTSGRAVIFSGITVVLSLLTVYRIDDAALRSLALGAIAVVVVAVLASATLLPALLTLLSPRLLRPGRVQRFLSRRLHAHSGPRARAGHGFWERWASGVMRRPVVCLIASAAVLVVLAIPALHLSMRSNAASDLPSADAAVVATKEASRADGPGSTGPVYVLVRYRAGTASAPGNRALTARVSATLAASPRIGHEDAPVAGTGGRSSIVTGVLTVDPESPQARTAVQALRTALARSVPHAQVFVGGDTATLVDFDHLVASSIVAMFLLILVLAFAVLLVLLRSVILPLKAICLNLLSVGAAYGALVAVCQWGWLGFLHLPRSPSIDTIVPPLVLVVAFGLSMDYEVFLLTRIRERYEQTGDTAEAVRHALARSATPISSAALIMVAVFLAFVSSGMPTIQRLGFALAVAVALDATVVRLVLVPAAMTVLGRWNWWLPGPLARWMPAVPSGGDGHG
jgi:RND superfamily putative drug exporter